MPNEEKPQLLPPYEQLFHDQWILSEAERLGIPAFAIIKGLDDLLRDLSDDSDETFNTTDMRSMSVNDFIDTP